MQNTKTLRSDRWCNPRVRSHSVEITNPKLTDRNSVETDLRATQSYDPGEEDGGLVGIPELDDIDNMQEEHLERIKIDR